MGTNYYVRSSSCADACPHCGLRQEIHIGKFSAGWQFLHRAYVDDQWRALPAVVEWIGCEIRDRRAWLVLVELGEIWDEYGRQIDRQELLARIEAARPGVASTQHGEWFDGPYWFCSGEFS